MKLRSHRSRGRPMRAPGERAHAEVRTSSVAIHTGHPARQPRQQRQLPRPCTAGLRGDPGDERDVIRRLVVCYAQGPRDDIGL